jgi:hypothetical protein
MDSIISIHTKKAPTIFTQKALAAWETLDRRFAAQLSSEEMDHLFARFVFGLTSPIHSEDEPIVHLDICRKILALKLTPERIDFALRNVPTASAPWVETAYQTFETLGAKEGRELLEHQQSRRPKPGTEDESPSVRAEAGRTQ